MFPERFLMKWVYLRKLPKLWMCVYKQAGLNVVASAFLKLCFIFRSFPPKIGDGNFSDLLEVMGFYCAPEVVTVTGFIVSLCVTRLFQRDYFALWKMKYRVKCEQRLFLGPPGLEGGAPSFSFTKTSKAGPGRFGKS